MTTSANAQSLQNAARLIELARGEETPDGNAMTAARHYITVMEIIASIVSPLAAAMDNLNAKKAFLCQVRGRMEMYYERAQLLLEVANETGAFATVDLGRRPDTDEGQQMTCPPSLYGGTAVMGIPLPPLQYPDRTGSTTAGSVEPYSTYLSCEAGSPPISAPINLDDLMKDLGAPKDL